jgi:transcriptional regulator with XRE-family HTH domain
VANVAGVTVYTYASIERGRRPGGRIANPTLDTILRVLAALDIDVELPGDGRVIAAAGERQRGATAEPSTVSASRVAGSPK